MATHVQNKSVNHLGSESHGFLSGIKDFLKSLTGRSHERDSATPCDACCEHDADRDAVDEAAEDSFPASDPPAWTSTGVKHG